MEKGTLSRRNFISGLGAAGALVVTGAALTGCASEPSGAGTQSLASADEGFAKKTDVLVIGGGIGGTMAALNAQKNNASVIVCEAMLYLGGTALISGGAIHIFGSKSAEEYLSNAPDMDPSFADVIANTFNNELLPFLAETGAPYKDRFDIPRALL